MKEQEDILEEFMAEVQHAIDEYLISLGCEMESREAIRRFCDENNIEITYDTDYMYILHNKKIIRRFLQPYSEMQ